MRLLIKTGQVEAGQEIRDAGVIADYRRSTIETG